VASTGPIIDLEQGPPLKHEHRVAADGTRLSLGEAQKAELKALAKRYGVPWSEVSKCIRLAHAPGPEADAKVDAVLALARHLAEALADLPDAAQTWIGRHTGLRVLDEVASALELLGSCPPLPAAKRIGAGRPATIDSYPARLAMLLAQLWQQTHGPGPITGNGRYGRHLTRGGHFVAGVVKIVAGVDLTPSKLGRLVQTLISPEEA
jgi:hypothetical protein